MPTEIERRYLLKSLPELSFQHTLSLRQGYLARGGYEVRLRASQTASGCTSYVLCRKEGTGLSREEHEEPLTRGQFELLWPLTEGRRLFKTRFLWSNGGGLNYEFDRFEGVLAPLVILEIELPYATYPLLLPPTIAAHVEREITGEVPYLNSSLSREGRPT